MSRVKLLSNEERSVWNQGYEWGQLDLLVEMVEIDVIDFETAKKIIDNLKINEHLGEDKYNFIMCSRKISDDQKWKMD